MVLSAFVVFVSLFIVFLICCVVVSLLCATFDDNKLKGHVLYVFQWRSSGLYRSPLAFRGPPSCQKI